MPTIYVPNESNVQAPAVAPDWSNGVNDLELSLPVDTDPMSAGSLWQSWKALGDWLIWTKNNFINMVRGLVSIAGIVVDGTGTATVAAPGADTPRARFYDGAGNLRWIVDHNGYPMGRRCEWRKEWYSISDGSMFLQPDSVTAGGNANYPANIARKNGGTTNGTNYVALTNFLTHLGFTGLSLVLEMELAFSTLLATNTLLFAGLLDGTGPIGAPHVIGFQRAGGDTNWQGVLTGAASIDLGVAPASGTTPTQRLRLEVHGSASPYGSGSNGKVRFFVNEVLRGEIAVSVRRTAS